MKNNPYKPDAKSEKSEEYSSGLLRKDVTFLSEALNILVCFLLCGGVGYYADHRLGTEKWTSVGALVGLAVGLYYFIKFIVKTMKGK